MAIVDFSKINNNIFDKNILEMSGSFNISWIFINEHCQIKMKERNISLFVWKNEENKSICLDVFISRQFESNWKSFQWERISYKWIIMTNWGYLVCKIFKNIKTNLLFCKILSVLTHDQLASSKNLRFWAHLNKYLNINISSQDSIITLDDINPGNVVDWLIKNNSIEISSWIQNITKDFYFNNKIFSDFFESLIVHTKDTSEVFKFKNIDQVPTNIKIKDAFTVSAGEYDIWYSLTYSKSGKVILLI
jgi:hypothetical protein